MRPHKVIGDPAAPYLERWIILESKWLSVFVHRISRSDERALHDHPGHNVSLILKGGYEEITPAGSFLRRAGSIIFRKADSAHRLVISRPVWTLFLMGPMFRQWGFHCARGWTPSKSRTLCGPETEI